MMAIMTLFALSHYFEGTPEALALCKAELITAGLLGFVAIGIDVFQAPNKTNRPT